MNSFGQQLRAYRRHCSDPQRGGLLTQERLGELIGERMGDAGYSGAAVSDWERDKSKIHADDRRLLVALLSALHKCGGLTQIDDANDLLTSGNYRRMDEEEVGAVFGEIGAGNVQAAGVKEGAALQAPVFVQEASSHLVKRHRTQRILLEKVENFWVDGVLKKSIVGVPALDLAKTTIDNAIDHPWEGSLGPALLSGRSDAGRDIIDLFNESDRALLILGFPGSGKTTTLIDLASSLLDIAKRDMQAQIPVILDLAGWAKERRDLTGWIVEELTAKYQIPRRYGRTWLDGDELVLLLDGFDVLPVNARRLCVNAVNRFRETNGLTGLAICSRTQEYLECGQKFRLNRAVKIEQLDEEQVNRYLLEEKHDALRHLIDSEKSVRQLAQSPLMLNVLATVIEDGEGDPQRGAIDAQPSLSIQESYKLVFDAYTRRMFGRRPRADIYDPGQTLKWLGWLAGRLEEHSLSIFMIEGIQPSWLPSKRWRWVYMLLSGLILGVSGGLIMWLLWLLLRYRQPQLPAAVSAQLVEWFHLSRGPVELLTILLANLMLGMITGVILGIFFEQRRRKPVEAAKINRHRWLQVWTVGLLCGLVTTLFVSLFTGWLISLAWGVAEGFMFMAAARFIFGWSYESDVRTVEALGWSWRRSLTGMGVGLILTLVAEILETLLYGYNGFERTLLTLALAGFILGGLTGSTTSAKSQPNQGVWMSLRNAGIAAVFLVVPLTLLTRILIDWTYALLIGVFCALIAASLFGGGVFVKHFLLRALLRLHRSLPWRYARFLDHAAQLVFLRKVGGGYIFMHRLLQQYFAGKRQNS